MRIKLNGPKGAPFVGQEFEPASMEKLPLSDVADLQRGAGMPMSKLLEHINGQEADPDNGLVEVPQDEVLAMVASLFSTLRHAGHKVSWDTVSAITLADIEYIAEPGDDAATQRMLNGKVEVTDEVANEATVDVPPSASTASRPAAADAALPTPATPDSRQ